MSKKNHFYYIYYTIYYTMSLWKHCAPNIMYLTYIYQMEQRRDL